MSATRRIAITAWTSPESHLKEDLEEIKRYDSRYSESRIAEEALMDYVPRLMMRLRIQPRRGQPVSSH